MSGLVLRAIKTPKYILIITIAYRSLKNMETNKQDYERERRRSDFE